MVPYVLLTAHFITSEWTLKSAVLNCKMTSQDYTADNLAEIIQHFLEKCNTPRDKTVCFSTDSGANIVKAIRILGVTRTSCFGHSINSAINKIFELDDLTAALEKVKKIQHIFARSFPEN